MTEPRACQTMQGASLAVQDICELALPLASRLLELTHIAGRLPSASRTAAIACAGVMLTVADPFDVSLQ